MAAPGLGVRVGEGIDFGTLDSYVPRLLLNRLESSPDDAVLQQDGTVVFVDISGFTRLSERLARVGREGAEHLTDAINACFSALLADAYANGGALLKFGGDALLLWFGGERHAIRACASAYAMRTTLRDVGTIRLGTSKVVLRMSAGVHSGTFETFLVGDSHLEYLVAGPAASRVVEMEAAASAGQILLTRETAAMLPRQVVRRVIGPGMLLAQSPSPRPFAPFEETHRPSQEAIARCLSTEVRAHVLAAPAPPEHRTAVVAFVQFGEFDELIERRGPRAAADALGGLVRTAQQAADLFQVCFLGSDVAADGGKLILTAGAPRAAGEDEERMLLTLRHIIEQPRELPVRIGVNRGQVFVGEIGPHYRRTYSVMGDTVNLSARLMAKAPWEHVYATRTLLDRSQTKFEVSRLEPFMVKGKVQPVEAWQVGPIARPVRSQRSRPLPLVGREAEYETLRGSVQRAKLGEGSLIEIVGETGSGKSRLLSEVRELADGLEFVHTVCQNYHRTFPYFIWRDVLRQLLGLHSDDPDEVVIAAILAQIDACATPLLPWLPLLAIAFDVQVPVTREVSELAADYRAARLHQVVLEFLEPLLRVPTLIQIEHGQFMDEASAALLQAVAGRIRSSSWVITVTRRDLAAGFTADPESSTRLELGPLSPDAMLALAESAPEASRIPPHTLELAVQRAGGSPEFLIDLLAAADGGSETLPDSVEAAASARIDGLAPGDRALVRRASVLGLSFHPRRLRPVLDPSAPEPDEETWRRLSGVFADEGDGYIRFKRPALCEAAYERLPFRLRRELHAAVGHSLERDLGSDVDADPAVLSLHFSLAGDHGRAWKYARAGAERAAARFAHADAAQLYRRAIEAGRQDGASRSDLVEAWECLGNALQRTGELAAAAQAMTTARLLVPEERLVQARLLYGQTIIAEHAARLTTAVRWGHRVLRMLAGLQESEAVACRARTLARLAFYRSRQGRLREAERLCHEAIADAQSSDELEALGYAYWTLDWVLFELGGDEHQGRYSKLALEIYERLGNLEQQGNVLNNLSVYAAERWRWDEALELLARAAECSRRAGIHHGVAATEVNIGEIMIDRGLYTQASQHLERARRIWRSTEEPAGAAYVDVMLGRLGVRDGRHAEGLALLDDAAARLRSLGEQGYTEFAESLLAEGEALAGDPHRALMLAERLIETTERALPLLHRIRAIALARLGDPQAGVALQTAIALARDSGALHDIALALDLAESLWWHEPERADERDAIVRRLGIERLPVLPIAHAGALRVAS